MRLKTAIVGVIYRKVGVSLDIEQYLSVAVQMHYLSLNN